MSRRAPSQMPAVRPNRAGESSPTMTDLICIAATAIFFAVAIAYTAGCRRLAEENK